MHALIIEDSYLIASTIEGTLRELGFTSFDLAARPDQAIAAAAARCPDLITADARLGDGSGVEAVLKICADKDIPVMFVVGDEGDVLDHLPDALIVLKPFSTRDLVQGVRAAISPNRRFASSPDAADGGGNSHRSRQSAQA